MDCITVNNLFYVELPNRRLKFFYQLDGQFFDSESNGHISDDVFASYSVANVPQFKMHPDGSQIIIIILRDVHMICTRLLILQKYNNKFEVLLGGNNTNINVHNLIGISICSHPKFNLMEINANDKRIFSLTLLNNQWKRLDRTFLINLARSLDLVD